MSEATATAFAEDPGAPSEVRLEALRYLVERDPASPPLLALLENWIADQPQRQPLPLRDEALRLMAVRNPARALQGAQFFLEKGDAPGAQTAWSVLASLALPEADALIANALEKGTPPAAQLDLLDAAAARAPQAPAVAEALARLEKNRAAPDDALAAFTECLEGGDAKLGREIALENVAANCVACHRFDNAAGSEVGPALIGVATRGDRRHLLESLVAPGAKVTMGYGLVSITRKSGEALSGTLLGEKDGALRLRLPDGKEVTIGKADIAAQTPPLSMMPPMGAILSKRQLRDVVAYLGTLKAKR